MKNYKEEIKIVIKIMIRIKIKRSRHP